MQNPGLIAGTIGVSIVILCLVGYDEYLLLAKVPPREKRLVIRVVLTALALVCAFLYRSLGWREMFIGGLAFFALDLCLICMQLVLLHHYKVRR